MSNPYDPHGPEQVPHDPHQGSQHRPQSPNGPQYAGPKARNLSSNGTNLINIHADENVKALKIEGSGRWKITLKPISEAAA